MCEGWGKCLRCWDALHERLCHPRALYHLQLLPVTTLRCWDGRFDWHCWRRLRASKCRFNCQPEIFGSKLQTWYFKTNYCVYRTCLKVSYWYTTSDNTMSAIIVWLLFPSTQSCWTFSKATSCTGSCKGPFCKPPRQSKHFTPKGLGISEILYFKHLEPQGSFLPLQQSPSSEASCNSGKEMLWWASS